MCVFKRNASKQPDYFIKPEDAKKWVEWLKEHRENPVYWRLATFMLLTGARVGEACGLKWDVIDLEKGLVRIIRRVRWDQKTNQPFLEDVTKTSQSTRLLVLPEKLKNIFREMRKEVLSDLVFTDRKGEALKYNAVQSSFNAGFIALKLPWRSNSYLPTHFCHHCSYGNKRSFCCSGKPWACRNKNDSKVCEDYRSFEFKNRRENS